MVLVWYLLIGFRLIYLLIGFRFIFICSVCMCVLCLYSIIAFLFVLTAELDTHISFSASIIYYL